jgi:hypothetical protein
MVLIIILVQILSFVLVQLNHLQHLFLSFSSSSDQQNVLLRHLDLNPTFLHQPFFSVLKRSTPNLADINFDHNKELEGELFRLGMKFDEIHEAVEQSEKEKASQRRNLPLIVNIRDVISRDSNEFDQILSLARRDLTVSLQEVF